MAFVAGQKPFDIQKAQRGETPPCESAFPR